MPHTKILEAVRRLVRHAFAELGAKQTAEVAESVLIRNDCYCGRRFRADGLQAVWFIEEDEIKVYDRNAAVVRVAVASQVSREDAAQPLRRAA
jgi:hypothetical protein